MPLIQGKSPEAFSRNVKTEMHSGAPQKQALAIAYSIKRRNKARGGLIESPEALKEASNYELMKERQAMAHGGVAKQIARDIMKKYAHGGMVNSEEALNTASEYEEGHEMNPEGAMDNETMPVDGDTEHDDFLSDEDDSNQMRGRIHRIMSGLHREHFMR